MEFTRDQRDFLDHIQGRMGSVYHQVSLRTHFELDTGIVTFPLWNLSGQLKGIQMYNWKGSKEVHNSREGRYHTVAKSGPCFYGAEFLNSDVPVTFISEGVFDSLSLLKFGNSVAILSNDPKPLAQQLRLLPGIKVAVCDDDKAGKELTKYADDYIICPEGKDPNDMTVPELRTLLGKYAYERDLYEDSFRTWWRREGKNL